MSNFSTKIGPGSPISPFTWIPQLLLFLNIENPRTWDVNCRHGVGLLSTSATCSGPPLDSGECHTGNRVHACSVSSLVLSISKLHKYWFLPRKVQKWTDIPACTPQIQGSPWVLKTLPMPTQGTSGHFPHLVSLFSYCYSIASFHKCPYSNIQAWLCPGWPQQHPCDPRMVTQTEPHFKCWNHHAKLPSTKPLPTGFSTRRVWGDPFPQCHQHLIPHIPNG